MDNSIKWWQSRTIWSTLIAALAGILSLTGHSIDPGAQAQLIDAVCNVANGVAVIAALAATYFRAKATAQVGNSADVTTPPQK